MSDLERQIRRARRPDGRVDIKSLDLDGLAYFMRELGKPEHRSLAVFKHMWQKDVVDFADVGGIPKPVRAQLGELAVITTLEESARVPAADGTTKFLWKLEDGSFIESVLIPDEDRPGPNPARYTLCVSTQVGCAMACTFCLTGDLGLKRNLTPAEMANQVHQVQQVMRNEMGGKRLTNVVMMGMGEPLHNLDNVVIALKTMLSEDALNLSHRRITVSTVGLVPKLEELAEQLPVNIAVSLNASTEEQRRAVMPVTLKYSMAELMDACRRLPLPSGKRITFEYVMMGGFNDSDDDAERLVQLMRSVPSKVNLIPYNENPDRDIRCPSDERVKSFQHYLVSRGVNCSIRTTRGRDVSAACGQLGKAAELMARRLPAPTSSSETSL